MPSPCPGTIVPGTRYRQYKKVILVRVEHSSYSGTTMGGRRTCKRGSEKSLTVNWFLPRVRVLLNLALVVQWHE